MLKSQIELLLIELITSISKSEFISIKKRIEMIKEVINDYETFTNK